MARDFGDERAVGIATESSASEDIASRLGLDNVRHFDTGLRWLQHHLRRKVFQLVKTPGSEKSSRYRLQGPSRKRHEAVHEETWIPRKDWKASESTLYSTCTTEEVSAKQSLNVCDLKPFFSRSPFKNLLLFPDFDFLHARIASALNKIILVLKRRIQWQRSSRHFEKDSRGCMF